MSEFNAYQAFTSAIEFAKKTGGIPARKSEKIVAGVEIIEWHFPSGSVLISEIHDYDHASFLLSGKAVLRTNGKDQQLTAPCMVEIKAGVEHALWALTDCAWDCIHSIYRKD